MPRQVENLPLGLFEKHRDALAARGFVDFAMFETDVDLFTAKNSASNLPCALVFLPKSRALINMTLALVSGMVREGGMIVLAGTNDAGIRSAKDSFEKHAGPVSEKIVGNHSALWVGTNARLGAGKKVEDFLSFAPLNYRDVSSGEAVELGLSVATLPGVFSTGALDDGTMILLDRIPYNKKSVLDVGCGAGVIGTVYKKKSPAVSVTMVDVSPLAVIASTETVKKNGQAGATMTVAQSDVFSNVKGAFDLIVSNPPFHKGVDTDYSFIETFARDAKKHLNKGGEVWIVANSFLPYKEILEKGIGPTEIVADDNKFRVYRSVA